MNLQKVVSIATEENIIPNGDYSVVAHNDGSFTLAIAAESETTSSDNRGVFLSGSKSDMLIWDAILNANKYDDVSGRNTVLFVSSDRVENAFGIYGVELVDIMHQIDSFDATELQLITESYQSRDISLFAKARAAAFNSMKITKRHIDFTRATDVIGKMDIPNAVFSTAAERVLATLTKDLVSETDYTKEMHETLESIYFG